MLIYTSKIKTYFCYETQFVIPTLNFNDISGPLGERIVAKFGNACLSEANDTKSQKRL